MGVRCCSRGRRSELEVIVEVDASSQVGKVELGGSAVEIMAGAIRTEANA